MKLLVISILLFSAGFPLPSDACAQASEQSSRLTSCFKAEFAFQRADTLLPGSPPRNQPPPPEWHSMISNLPGDWLHTGESAVSLRSMPAIGAAALATGVLLVGDHVTYTASRDFMRHSRFVHSASDVFVQVGDGRTTLGIAALFAAYGFADDDNRALRTASETVEAFLASGIVVQLLKHVTGRESPQAATSDRGTWRMFPSLALYNRNQARYYSFPSGHMTTTMATVTVIAENYPDAAWLRPVGYTLAGLLGVSLVNVGMHWYSDFPLAVLMGYAFGRIASHHEDNAPGAGGCANESGLRLLPGINSRGAGMTLAYSF